MTIATDYPDYRTLVERESPLGFARHFALCEILVSGHSASANRDALHIPGLPPLPAAHLGDFSRADNRFRWSDSPLAQGLRELGGRNAGFACLASEGFDADVQSPLELGAACSALLTPTATFLPLITSSGFGLFMVSELPVDLRQLSVTSTMATLREAIRCCRSAAQEWAPPLLSQLGFSCEPNEQGMLCCRGEEHFRWSFTNGSSELIFGQSRPGLRALVVGQALSSLIEQGLSHLNQAGDHAAARQSLLEAVVLDPQSYEAQLHLGRVELADGRLEQAELRLLLASLLGPRKGYALSLLGDCYALADKVPQAIAVLERLLVLDPENEEAKESLERLKSSL